MKKLKQAGGNWVSGDRFWNRENDVELFMKQIEEGAHLLLVAQRRMGKTSLMQEAARRLGGRFTCLFVDVQKAASPSDAIVELSKAIYPHKKVWKKAVSVFGNVAQELADRIEKVNIGQIGVKLRAGLTEGNWVAKGDELLAILADVTPAVVLL
ncbi:MAG TPA: ATP-binding protein, partial [Candidatus Hydrogenedentes bacterium]|nr:ATP-binding protein [Candidatus Hydrogenedentota bacterium]